MGGGYQGHKTSRRRFQQRHYEAVAELLLCLKSRMLVTVRGDTEALWIRTVEEFNHMFLMDSNRDVYGSFRQDKFYKACGYAMQRMTHHD